MNIRKEAEKRYPRAKKDGWDDESKKFAAFVDGAEYVQLVALEKIKTTLETLEDLKDLNRSEKTYMDGMQLVVGLLKEKIRLIESDQATDHVSIPVQLPVEPKSKHIPTKEVQVGLSQKSIEDISEEYANRYKKVHESGYNNQTVDKDYMYAAIETVVKMCLTEMSGKKLYIKI